MLNRFRESFKRFVRPVAKSLIKMGVSPNKATLIGLFIALATPFLTYYYKYTGLLIGLILSALFDAVDGEIARISGRTSLLGAFLDSFFDRISDVLYLYSLYFIGVSLDIILILTVLSILISYARARGEGLGVRVEGVGLMERGERIIYLVILVFLSAFYENILIPGLYVLMILLLYTLIERVYNISLILSKKK